MTLKDTIAADRAAVFLNSDEFAAAAVWTPAGGVAQPTIYGFFNDFPMHGDEEQVLEVEQPRTVFICSSADVGSIRLRDTIVINSTTYEVINDPYPQDSYWSILDLRLKEEIRI